MSSLPVWDYELHYIAQRDEIHSIGILRRRSRNLQDGVDVDDHNFHMNHTITAESLAAVRTWLEK